MDGVISGTAIKVVAACTAIDLVIAAKPMDLVELSDPLQLVLLLGADNDPHEKSSQSRLLDETRVREYC